MNKNKQVYEKYLLVLLVIILATPVSAQYGDPYYAFEESWAITKAKCAGGYNISTFIPRMCLLFISNRDSSITVNNQPFLEAITQDGVCVLVHESTVSKKPFIKSVGSHEVVFNAPYNLCRSMGCNTEDSDQVWRIHAGESFKRTPLSEGQMIKLTGRREDNELTGYIGAIELEDLTKRGVVTRADLRYPKYEIKKIDLTSLDMACGKIYEIGRKIIRDSQSETALLDSLAVVTFGLGTVGPEWITYEKSIGSRDKAYTFHAYEVENTRTDNNFALVAAVTYECVHQGVDPRKVRISHVDLRSPDGSRQIDLSASDFIADDALKDYVKTPYLFSVNNYYQYINLMDRLGQIFGDRSLAGYFLSEFNRSCGSENRQLEVSKSYSYK